MMLNHVIHSPLSSTPQRVLLVIAQAWHLFFHPSAIVNVITGLNPIMDCIVCMQSALDVTDDALQPQ